MTLLSRRSFAAAFVTGSAAPLLSFTRAAAQTDAEPKQPATSLLLTPQLEEGPFYVKAPHMRADIHEGRQGVPLTLSLTVLDVATSAPVTGARVDIWHCDAQGFYSAYPGQGDDHRIDMTNDSFLRGSQISDGLGAVRFDTIYPGWYDGRATHIHFKVFLDERNVLTAQTFLPDALNEFIYLNVPAYARKRERLVVNANDGIARDHDPERRTFCNVREGRDHYEASLVLGIDRNAVSVADQMPPMGFLGAFFGPPRMPALKDRLAALVPGVR